jgi:hypothetical protein|tara:strand:- start:1883 stop:2089 length:207 start_codon:yes stop_codon:yes gene_type:complete
LLLYTDFEDINSLKRQLPYLKGLSKNNVVAVVFFKNSEIENTIAKTSKHEKDYYYKSVAEKIDGKRTQ